MKIKHIRAYDADLPLFERDCTCFGVFHSTAGMGQP